MAYTTINKSTDYFNTVLYTGNTTDDRTISGVGFQPDWNWTKNRSATQHHWVADAVRGSSKMLMPDLTNAEYNAPSQGSIASFNADGYVLQAGSSADENYNYENNNYVSWNWKANGAGSANTDGTISSTVSANTTAGFSIVSYTGNLTDGATVGHGLGVAPDMMIIKNRSDTQYWVVYHKDLGGANNHLRLDGTAAKRNDLNMFSSTAPTSSVFEIGTQPQVNGNTNNIISYCFAEKKGYSKFGSYTGNGSADGIFVYTGFKPAFVLIKRSDGTPNWTINDTARDPTNVNNLRLFPNQNVVESSGSDSMDMLSNGFKLRSTDGGNNFSGGTFIYMAFGQSLVGSNNVPCTAR